MSSTARTNFASTALVFVSKAVVCCRRCSISPDSHSVTISVRMTASTPLPSVSSVTSERPTGMRIASSSVGQVRQHADEIQHDDAPDRERDRALPGLQPRLRGEELAHRVDDHADARECDQQRHHGIDEERRLAVVTHGEARDDEQQQRRQREHDARQAGLQLRVASYRRAGSALVERAVEEPREAQAGDDDGERDPAARCAERRAEACQVDGFEHGWRG